MSLRLRQWLSDASAQYRSVRCESSGDFQRMAEQCHLPLAAIVRVVSLTDSNGRLAVLIPSDHMLDFSALKQLTGREFDVMPNVDVQKYFPACVDYSRPAFAMAYGWPCVCDRQLLHHNEVAIESGDGKEIFVFEVNEFQRLLGDTSIDSVAVSPSALANESIQNDSSDVISHFLPLRFKNRVQETFDLPPMPEIAQEILKLRADPNASARDLANVVSKDPSLSAQIMSWANSPYYGYAGRIPSLEMAIMRVLGFEMVLNLSLGIAVGRTLKVPKEGPLGLKAFWTQAVLCAVLSERICQRMPPKIRPQRGLVYLAGLLHNFGHLLLGHVFPPQFYLVNRYVEANPHIAVETVERFVLGVTHEEIGAWLMQAWQMPEELTTAVRWHHQEDFTSPYAVYSNIVLVANRLLKRMGIGDASNGVLPESLLSSLQLAPSDMEAELLSMQSSREDFTQLAQRLVA